MVNEYSEGINLAAPAAVETVAMEVPVENGGSIDPEVAEEMAPIVKEKKQKKEKAQIEASEVATEGAYTMVKNVKHNGTKYLIGEKVDLDETTAKAFALAGFIQ